MGHLAWASPVAFSYSRSLGIAPICTRCVLPLSYNKSFSIHSTCFVMSFTFIVRHIAIAIEKSCNQNQNSQVSIKNLWPKWATFAWCKFWSIPLGKLIGCNQVKCSFSCYMKVAPAQFFLLPKASIEADIGMHELTIVIPKVGNCSAQKKILLSLSIIVITSSSRSG